MLTSKEVAAALGVSPKRARQLLQQGRIPGATKIGRDWLAPEPLRVIPGKRGPKPQAKSVAPTGRRQDFERLLETQRLIQRHFPECVLVGGTAAALHAGHRFSEDVDSVLTDLNSRFPQVLAKLEQLAGWQTNRVQPPVLILGSLQGVEVGIRQLVRSVPLETQIMAGIVVPTLAEMLRIKGWLIVRRNALRDFLDFCALADKLGAGLEAALEPFDRMYPQPPDSDSTSQQLAKQLAQPLPREFAAGKPPDLSMWKGLQPPWTDWTYVEAFCRALGGRLLDLALDLRWPPKEAPADAPPSS
ncbi:MAG: nucleotidyl transferase AbiEii/AbiGii toxin family protein [Thermaerobacter sp.]|nr:nucleotidyl transferase AbiEii/AbiGii toxin family protein [Thermaerobacter sp.]MDA8145132.1 nucleotidyl transferase AbiEii/AbiGii toxin family protein [Thermaerobacter sp.]